MKRYLIIPALAAGLLTAQTLDPKLLLKPATDAWPTYNGDYSGKRFSPLNQINSANVANLTLALVLPHRQCRCAAWCRQSRDQVHSLDG